MSIYTILGIVIAIAVIAYVMKDKIAGSFSNPEYDRKHALAMEKITGDFDGVLKSYVDDKDTFKFLKDITGEKNIKGILVCKKQTSIGKAMKEAAKTTASGIVKIEVGVAYYIVMGEDTIYNVQTDTETKEGKVLKTFKKSEIESINIKKANMVDDLKQAQKFKLASGGMSGDGADNSNLKKMIIKLAEKKEEFFCYEAIFEGPITREKTMAWGAALNEQTEKDILEVILSYTIPQKTFEKLVQEYNGTIE